MTIENAIEQLQLLRLKIIKFITKDDLEALYMAIVALSLIKDHKKIIITLDRMKDDHIAQVLEKIEEEGSGNNGK